MTKGEEINQNITSKMNMNSESRKKAGDKEGDGGEGGASHVPPTLVANKPAIMPPKDPIM